MPTPRPLGDPRTGRDRRVPTKTRTFQDGKLDPIITNKRPLLTIGNGVLLVIMIGFGLYATGNLPQLDAFFAHADEVGRAHNNVVVNALITYGTFIFGIVLLAVFGLVVFLFVNTRRRRASDPKGWHKVADAPPERRKSDRRADETQMPSMVMPLGKSRPPARIAEFPQAPAAVKPNPVGAGKASAMAAAVKAQTTLASSPADLPSFVMPLGKSPKTASANAPSGTRTMQPAVPLPSASAPAPVVKTVASSPALVASPATDISLLSLAATNARAEATIAAAKAAAAQADAAIATAKAEAAIAAARAEMAIAEATVAAAKASILPN